MSRPRRTWIKPIAMLAVAGAVLLVCCRSLAVRLPGVTLQSRADEAGLHLQVFESLGPAGMSVSFAANNLGSVRYPSFATVWNVLGLVVAFLPRTFNGGDFLAPPFAALVLPYWLIVVASIVVGLWVMGWLGAFVSQVRGAAKSWIAVALVLAGFLALNAMPQASRPGAMIYPDTLLDRAALLFWPETYPEIYLQYGFPAECYTRAFIGGRPVAVFYGNDELGWKQHKLMENLLIALATALAVGWAVGGTARFLKSASRPSQSSTP